MISLIYKYFIAMRFETYMFVLPDLTCDLVTYWDIPDISVTPKFIDKDKSVKN